MNKFTLFFLLSFLSLNTFSEEPVVSQTNPEESILFWDKQQKISGFKNGYNFVPSRAINKSLNPYPLNYLLLDFSELNFKILKKYF